MLPSLSLRAKLYGLAVVAVAMIAAIAAMLFYSNAESTESLRRVYEENVTPLHKIQLINDLLGEVRFNIAAVITDQLGPPRARSHLNEIRQTVPGLWAEYRKLSRSGPMGEEERKLNEAVDAGMTHLPAIFTKLDSSYDAANGKDLLGTILEDEWPTVIVQVTKPLGKLIALRTPEVEQAYRAAHRSEIILDRYATGLVIVALALMGVLTTIIVRAITRPITDVQLALARVARGDLTAKCATMGGGELGKMAKAVNSSIDALCQTFAEVRSGSDRVASAAGRVTSSADHIHGRAQRQSDEIMKMTAAMQQLTVSVSEISSGSAHMSDAALVAREAAEQGSQLMRDSRLATERAQQAANQATTAVTELSATVQQIAAISKVIREIADQTNLLALNAAIEAARAGEAGRGFAVVADEVRKLAERTGQSTSEIGAIVHTVGQQADCAVQAMCAVDRDVSADAAYIVQLEGAFAQILDAARRVSSLSQDVAHSTGEQKIVTEQTARGMEAISQTVEETTATIAQMAAAAGDSAATAESLLQIVGTYRTA